MTTKTEKYFLLTFDDDYGDEHDVPALACFTEEEYHNWLERPSGRLNPDYEEKNKVYEEYQVKQQAYYDGLRERGLWNKNPKDYTYEDQRWIKDNQVEYVSGRDAPKRVFSAMSAYLGNSGECFEESYSHLYLFKEFVEEGTVKVTEVDKSFYDYFHKANLKSLSLCNVFTMTEEELSYRVEEE